MKRRSFFSRLTVWGLSLFALTHLSWGETKMTQGERYLVEFEGKQSELLERSLGDLERIFKKFELVKGEKESAFKVVLELDKTSFEGTTLERSWRDQTFEWSCQEGEIRIRSASQEGLSLGVYELLDRLGCRWYFPGAQGEVLPVLGREGITLKEGKETIKPAFVYRKIWYSDPNYLRRNRLGGLTVETRHQFESILPKKTMEENPQWYGKQGDRVLKNRLNWAAPGLAQALEARIDKILKKDPDTYSLSLGDGVRFSDTPEERALDQGVLSPVTHRLDLTDRALSLLNQFVPSLEKKYPGVRFGWLAYSRAMFPPEKEAVPASLVVEIAPIDFSRHRPISQKGVPDNLVQQEIFEGWSSKAKSLSFYPYFWFLSESIAPFPMITKVSEDLKYISDKPVHYYRPETIPNFETSLPGLYLGVRGGFKGVEDKTKILQKMYRDLYGPAALELGLYWEYWDTLWQTRDLFAGADHDMLQRIEPFDLFFSQKLLDLALTRSLSEVERYRVEMVRASLEHFRLRYEIQQRLVELDFKEVDRLSKELFAKLRERADFYGKNRAFQKMGWTKDSTYPELIWGYQWGKTVASGLQAEEDFAGWDQQILPVWRWRASQGDSWKRWRVGYDSWSSQGLHSEFIPVTFRTRASVKKGASSYYLWLGGWSGNLSVSVDGQEVPWPQGPSVTKSSAYIKPQTIDLSSYVPADKTDFLLELRCDRTHLEEVGAGGLVIPPALWSH